VGYKTKADHGESAWALRRSLSSMVFFPWAFVENSLASSDVLRIITSALRYVLRIS